jgi:hypothetical protein
MSRGIMKSLVTIKTFKPLSVRRTETGFSATLDKQDVEAFLASNPANYFYVEGVPVSASTELLRDCPAPGTSPI